jgi:hypothetical protein
MNGGLWDHVAPPLSRIDPKSLRPACGAITLQSAQSEVSGFKPVRSKLPARASAAALSQFVATCLGVATTRETSATGQAT